MSASVKCKHSSEPINTETGVFFICKLKLFDGTPTWSQCSECTSFEGDSRGFGDTVAKVSKAVGIKPCKPCQKRRQLLNKVLPYDSKNSKPKTSG